MATTSERGSLPTDELQAFLDVLATVPPDGLTACPAWSVHLLAAHVAGAYTEITRHIEGYLAGRPVTRTRTFDEREPKYRAMSTADLVKVMHEDEAEMIDAIRRAQRVDPDAEVHWTNRFVRIDSFLEHLQMECAIHRWDIVGDDPAGDELLAGKHLLEHTVESVTAVPLTARGRAAGAGQGRPLQGKIRAHGQPDVLVSVFRGTASMTLVPPEGEAVLEGDPAARLLMLWGRHTQPPTRLVCTGAWAEAARLNELFIGY